MKDANKLSTWFDLDAYEEAQGNDIDYIAMLEKTLALCLTYLHENMLEYGAGTGLFTQKILPHTKNLELIEPDEGLHDKLKEKAPNNTIHTVEAECYQSEKQYDLIVGTEAMHHIENKELFLSNMHGLLDSNGVLVIADVFMPEYKDEKEREKIVREYFNNKFSEFEKQSNGQCCSVYEKAMQKEINQEGEYKICIPLFEKLVEKTGFKIVEEIPITRNIDEVGGHMIYVLKKK